MFGYFAPDVFWTLGKRFSLSSVDALMLSEHSFKFFIRVLLVPTLFILSLSCCSSGPSEEERIQRDKAVSFVELVANYTPENVEKRFESAKEYLSISEQQRFIEGVLKAELVALKAVGRSQHFEIREEEIAVINEESGETLIEVPGLRTRNVGSSASQPVELYYALRFSPPVAAKDSSRGTQYPITKVEFHYLEGQEKALQKERLLERFKEASQAAEEERQQFRKVVDDVNQDLKAHEKKVEERVKGLGQSLDRLGTTVRKLHDETEELKKKRQEEAQEAALRMRTPTPTPEPETTQETEKETPKGSIPEESRI